MFKSRVVWVLLGIAGGVAIGLAVGPLRSVVPTIPLHAVATHGQDSFAMCTGPVDGTTEGVFVLDFATGDLAGTVLSQKTGKFISRFKYNVSKDLAADSKNPRYLMVTGLLELQRGPGTPQLANSIVYVAEVNSGKMAAYVVPWKPQAQNAGLAQVGTFIPLDRLTFRDAVVR